jgi:hypothetical protein
MASPRNLMKRASSYMSGFFVSCVHLRVGVGREGGREGGRDEVRFEGQRT